MQMDSSIIKDIQRLRHMGESMVELSSQLEKKLAPVQGGAARKGKVSSVRKQILLADKRRKMYTSTKKKVIHKPEHHGIN